MELQRYPQPHCTCGAPSVQKYEVGPQMQLQLGTPLHIGGRSAHEGGPLTAPAIPLQKALQYWLGPQVVSPQLTPDEPPLPDTPPADVAPPPPVAPVPPA